MSPRSRSLDVLVAGLVGGVPNQGGATWAVLQYLVGLRRLGHHVRFVESVRGSDLVPAGAPIARSRNGRYVREVMDRFGFGSDWSIVSDDPLETAGAPYDHVLKAAASSDLLVNLGGTLTDPEVISRARVRAYVDLDPCFTQVWQEDYGIDMGLDAHNIFVTVAQALGEPECTIPACGREWVTTIPPVVLDEWAPSHDAARSWSTVANWRSYGPVSHAGLVYGQKAHSWRGFFALPHLTGEVFEVALAIDAREKEDLEALRSGGWTLVDPVAVVDTPHAYRDFVRGSKAEFAVAKSGYVLSSSGWFSDRSACYLAAARPVVAQDTGFSRFLPTGEGLLSFSNEDEAIEAVARVVADYAKHRRAARRLAQEWFDSDRVLAGLLNRLGVLS